LGGLSSTSFTALLLCISDTLRETGLFIFFSAFISGHQYCLELLIFCLLRRCYRMVVTVLQMVVWVPTDFWVPSLIHALDFSEYLALFGSPAV